MKQNPIITVIGSLNMDIVVQSERFPEPGETINGQGVQFVPGGKGANQAVAAARLGAMVRMVGFIGEDAFGDALIRSLDDSGVHTRHVNRVSSATGIASIVLANDDNQIIVVPGANAHCLPEHLPELEAVIADSDIIVMQLEIPVETVHYAAKLAKKHQKTVILNPAPAIQLPKELMPLVDYITPNESELYLLANLKAVDSSLEQALDALLSQGTGCVVATLGAQGSVMKRVGEGSLHIPALDVEVVDTTGAGDAYNAGLACGISSGLTLEEALRLATAVSAVAVSRFGAQTGMPTMEDVQAKFYNNRP